VTDPRTPCIIGVSQKTYRPEDAPTPEPLDLWEEQSRAAARDSGGNSVLSAVDSVRVVYPLSWQYDDAPGRLADRLGLADGERFYSGLSGTTPQQLVNRAGAEILAGEREMVLIASGEALAEKKRLKKAGKKPTWSHAPQEKRGIPFADPFHPAEIAHQVFRAYLTFAIFDVARRANKGLTPKQNREQVGRLLSSLTKVAASNPNAWFPRERTPEELIDVTPDNRMVAYPYAKKMVSIMDIDMAAAILVTSHEKADALGVSGDRRVNLRGWGYAQDPVYVAERNEMWRSPAMKAASEAALAGAGIGIDDVAYLDLYSCFGSSVNFATDALGISADDSRPLTVTGGLPYFGGAGNGYVNHSIATMVEKLREDSSALGLVSGVGMHMQNHVFGVYSATPGAVAPPDAASVQAAASLTAKREIRDTATGPASIAAYSVIHGRESPLAALAVCDLPGGARCYARSEDPSLMASMEEEEWVGRDIELVDGGNKVNSIKA
jgi:acetyl-CoA C-acetyltransferase